MEAKFLVIVPLVTCCVALCVIFFLAYFNFGRRAYALSWALTFGCAALAYSSGLLADRFPSPQSYWAFASLLSCTTVTLGLRGHLQRVGREIKLRYTLLGVFVFLLELWVVFVQPHFGIQIAGLPLHAAAVNALQAWVVLRFRKKPLPMEWGLATVGVLFALSQLAAGLVALSQGSTQDDGVMAVYFYVNFLAMPSCFIAMGMFSVLIVANDLADEMRQLAAVDTLTGLANRRGMTDAMTRAWAAASRANQMVSVLLADLDDFKAINDQHGHDVGDQVLQALGKRLATHGRGGDLISRWGGDEFVIMLTGPAADEALSIARRIENDIQALPISTSAGAVAISAHIGAATGNPREVNIEKMLELADAQMYERKLSQKAQQRPSSQDELATSPQLGT